MRSYATICSTRHGRYKSTLWVFTALSEHQWLSGSGLFVSFWNQVRHGAGTGLREILKCHGAAGGKLVGSTAEQVFLTLPLFRQQ